jgi:hypothetical protein
MLVKVYEGCFNMYYLKLKKDFLKTIEDPKELLMLYYLFIIENKEGDILFSLKNFLEYWNYKPKRNEDKINHKIKNILIKFKQLNIIHTDYEIHNITISTNIHIRFSTINNLPWYMIEQQLFTTLAIGEIKQLKNYCFKFNNIQIDKVLLLYLTIKSHMNFSSQSLTFCFASIDTLVKETNISKQTIAKYIDILIKCNLIYTYNVGNFINTNNKIIPTSTVYTLQNIEIKTIKNNLSAYLYNFKEWEMVV